MKRLKELLVLALLLSAAGCAEEETADVTATEAPAETTAAAETEEPESEETAAAEEVSLMTEAQQAFIDAVDVDYSYNLAMKIIETNQSNELGYRTAGSEAELATGDLLKEEMESIGLTNVTKDEFTVDGWEFGGASITFTDAEGNETTAELGGYQCDLNVDGDYTVVYAGQGTEADLADIDVTGKIVMIDINQSENWWINYPAYEAYLNGALCVMAVQDGGYAEHSDETLNAQDICGPAYAAAVSLSRADAEKIQAVLDENNETTVHFTCDSTVMEDTTTYNIVGMIEGKDADSYVLMSGHYDSYYDGFQDDNAAIGILMGIAKGLVDSGYQPEKTLVFCCMAAEEWGVSDTRYDWSTGAYNEIFKVHPEWAGKVVADINFELPASGGDTDGMRIAYELMDFASEHAEKVPTVEGAYENGIEMVPTSTWSDDFSLSIAGIPSSVTLSRDGFKAEYYHSQFDDEETYDEAGYTYNHYFYGTLMIAYDMCAVSPLNFSTRLEAFEETVAASVIGEDKSTELLAAVDAAEEAASAAWEAVQSANAEYVNAILAGDEDEIEAVKEKYTEMNTEVLTAFKYIQDNLLCLTWEDVPQFPHEHYINNIQNLAAAVSSLQAGSVSEALDEYLWGIDNNWYAFDWSKETYDYMTNYVLNADDEHLMWGKNMVLGHEDLYDVIQSLKTKEDGADCTEEIAVLTADLENEEAQLSTCVDGEISSLAELTDMLNQIAE